MACFCRGYAFIPLTRILWLTWFDKKNKKIIYLAKENSQIKIDEKREEALIEINKIKQIDKDKNQLIMQNNLNEIVKKMSENLIEPSAFKMQIECFSQQVSEKNKTIYTTLMQVYCKKKDHFTEDDISKFETLFNLYFRKIITKSKKLLIEKLMNKVDMVSTKAMMFLINLNENELDILKKQFAYTATNTDSGYIICYDEIREDLRALQLNARGYNNKMKFFNEIWQYDAWKRKITQNIVPNQDMQICGSNKAVLLIEGNSIAYNRKIHIMFFYQLTELGFEIYNFLKDEIPEYPDGYLIKIIEYLKILYSDLSFIINNNHDNP